MDWVNVTGSINSFLVIVSVYGIWLQLRTIWQRRAKLRVSESDELPTEVLSANQFFVSFLAYYSFLCYGLALTPINHFLIWPRIVACLLVALIIMEIATDRKNKTTKFCQYLMITMLSFAIAMLLVSLGSYDFHVNFTLINVMEGRGIATAQIVVVTLMLAQGYFRQIFKVVKTGKTGAIDIRMSQFLLLMDMSTLAFGLSLGVNNGWPLLFLATTSAITKLIIMYLFIWVRVSPRALLRRSQ